MGERFLNMELVGQKIYLRPLMRISQLLSRWASFSSIGDVWADLSYANFFRLEYYHLKKNLFLSWGKAGVSFSKRKVIF